MASSSSPNQLSVLKNCSYPNALASYEEVLGSQKLFMDTLERLHSQMGTKFMIPIIGGRDLDLHKLFVEVTSRGGIEKIIKERRWKEVTATFNFPPTATNASFVLRKYYSSLLYHYEQIYFFKSHAQIPADSLQNLSAGHVAAVHGTIPHKLEIQPVKSPQPKIGSSDLLSASVGLEVMGVIDGKFDDGYLVTIAVGSEALRGVLYEIPNASASQAPQIHGFTPNNFNNYLTSSAPAVGTKRRRRRKKCEIKRRDPAHPKPNRSGYNFFFAEQHARLKLIHSGKDREISRMIGELWNKLNEQERAVYQEKAVKDKERYRAEMEAYREGLRLGQIISQAVPLQQCFPQQDSNMIEAEEDPEEDDDASSGNSSKSVPGDHQDCDSDAILQDAYPIQSGPNPPNQPKGVSPAGAFSGEKNLNPVDAKEL